MIKSFFRKYFLPQEIVVIPFTILVIGIYRYFKLNFILVPPFVYWLILILMFFLLLHVASGLVIHGFKYIFRHESVSYNFDFVKFKNFVRVLLSLVVILIIYENLQYAVTDIARIDQDAALLFYDNLLFGKNHITLLLQPYISNSLTEWMNFAYLSFFFYPPILGVYFYVKNRIQEWSTLVLTITLALFFGYIFYIIFPALGPGVYLQNEFTRSLDGSYITNVTQALVSTEGFSRGTFPSLHVCLSAIYLFFAYKNSHRLFYIFLPVIMSLWVSTIYLRYHYLYDVIAGFFLAIICLWLGEFIQKKWYEINQKQLD